MWFLEIAFVQQAGIWVLKIIYGNLSLKNHSNMSSAATLCVIFNISIIDGRGLINEVRHELLPKKGKVILYLLYVPFIIKGI